MLCRELSTDFCVPTRRGYPQAVSGVIYNDHPAFGYKKTTSKGWLLIVLIIGLGGSLCLLGDADVGAWWVVFGVGFSDDQHCYGAVVSDHAGVG